MPIAYEPKTAVTLQRGTLADIRRRNNPDAHPKREVKKIEVSNEERVRNQAKFEEQWAILIGDFSVRRYANNLRRQLTKRSSGEEIPKGKFEDLIAAFSEKSRAVKGAFSELGTASAKRKWEFAIGKKEADMLIDAFEHPTEGLTPTKSVTKVKEELLPKDESTPI